MNNYIIVLLLITLLYSSFNYISCNDNILENFGAKNIFKKINPDDLNPMKPIIDKFNKYKTTIILSIIIICLGISTITFGILLIKCSFKSFVRPRF